jgi:hypothetical protein
MNTLDLGFVQGDYNDGGEVDDMHDNVIQQMECISLEEWRQRSKQERSKQANLDEVVWWTEGMFVGGSYILERFSSKETKEFVNSMVNNQPCCLPKEYL